MNNNHLWIIMWLGTTFSPPGPVERTPPFAPLTWLLTWIRSRKIHKELPNAAGGAVALEARPQPCTRAACEAQPGLRTAPRHAA